MIESRAWQQIAPVISLIVYKSYTYGLELLLLFRNGCFLTGFIATSMLTNKFLDLFNSTTTLVFLSKLKTLFQSKFIHKLGPSSKKIYISHIYYLLFTWSVHYIRHLHSCKARKYASLINEKEQQQRKDWCERDKCLD